MTIHPNDLLEDRLDGLERAREAVEETRAAVTRIRSQHALRLVGAADVTAAEWRHDQALQRLAAYDPA